MVFAYFTTFLALTFGAWSITGSTESNLTKVTSSDNQYCQIYSLASSPTSNDNDDGDIYVVRSNGDGTSTSLFTLKYYYDSTDSSFKLITPNLATQYNDTIYNLAITNYFVEIYGSNWSYLGELGSSFTPTIYFGANSQTYTLVSFSSSSADTQLKNNMAYYRLSLSFTLMPTDTFIIASNNEQTYQEGYQKGFEQGGLSQSGYWFDMGKEQGVSDYLHSQDYADALQDQYDFGYDVGKSQGETIGYNNGFDDASNGHYTFFSLFGSIADTPIMFLRQLLGFEVFGVQAMSILMSMLTGCIALYLIRKIIL